MTRKKKTLMIAVVSILVLAFSSAVAYATTNTSEIEDLYKAFRSAQVESAVENGQMTQDEADEYLSNLTARMEADEKDAVPPLNGRKGALGMKRGKNCIDLYAELSGKTADELIQTLKESKTSVFAIADEAGLLDGLKEAMLNDAYANIDQALENGRIDQEKADEMKTRAEERISAITADTKMPAPRAGGRGPQGKSDIPSESGK